MAKHIHILIGIGISALIGLPQTALSAEVKVLSDGPLEPALTRIGEAFQGESGNTVKFGFGLSPEIHKRGD